MAERGAALIEALIVTAISAVIWTAAVGVIAELPARSAAWDEAAAARQVVRAIEGRVGRLAASVTPIVVEVEGTVVRVPAVWPRRLGLLRPGGVGEVSRDAITLISRVDGHRAVTLSAALPIGGGQVPFEPQRGCGTAVACGLRAGDHVLVIDRTAACGLFRVVAAGARLDLDPLMPTARSFIPGSVIVPVAIDVIAFDGSERAVRRYDGYRSDNIVADGILGIAIAARGPVAADLGDGPFIGDGALAFDADQLSVITIELEMTLAAIADRPQSRMLFHWRVRAWP
jgi:hypothetical protein